MTITFHAGLHSSILSALKRSFADDLPLANHGAKLLQNVFRRVVDDINLGLRIARQWQNLAIRMVFESQTLSQRTKKVFYRNILYSDEVGKQMKYGTNGACKTHAWFVKAVFGSAQKNPPKVNVPGPRIFNDADEDPFFGFSADGKVETPDVLSALPNDPHIGRLLDLFSDNKVIGNIILAARRLWYRGFDGRWEDADHTIRSTLQRCNG